VKEIMDLFRRTSPADTERQRALSDCLTIVERERAELIELVKSEYADKQVFYAYTDEKFYQLSVDFEGTRTIAEVTGYETYTGRQGLYFQYRHNAPLSRRIDPGTTNIIDLYLVTQSYYIAYQNFIRDSTGTVAEPTKPTIDELRQLYINTYIIEKLGEE